MQQDREALQATDGCLRLGAEHNLRTYSCVLLRRSLANERLGHEAAANNAFAEAFYIMHKDRALTPMLGLPADELETLLQRLIKAHPDLQRSAAFMHEGAAVAPKGAPSKYSSLKLTPRELVVAQWLRSELPLTQVAARLNVSNNTLKTQVRTLYRKLGATSREQAVLRLERSLFYEQNHEQP